MRSVVVDGHDPIDNESAATMGNDREDIRTVARDVDRCGQIAVDLNRSDISWDAGEQEERAEQDRDRPGCHHGTFSSDSTGGRNAPVAVDDSSAATLRPTGRQGLRDGHERPHPSEVTRVWQHLED